MIPMKHKIGILLLLFALVCVAWSLVGCSDNTPYGGLDKAGYDVSVRFDINGGFFAGTGGVTLVDVFNSEEIPTDAAGNPTISLLAPDDPKRGNNAYEVSRVNHVLAGWFQKRTPVTDAAGNHLDCFGNITEDESQYAYTYSEKWDFSKDTLQLEKDKTYSSHEDALVLYAGWIPYSTYEFYYLDDAGNPVQYATQMGLTMSIPAWSQETGKLNMEKFPAREGMTLDGVYTDPALQHQVTDTVAGDMDMAHGVNNTPVIRLYTTWLTGEWFHIYTAEQFVKNSRLDGSYFLHADLDFTGLNWSRALSEGVYTGTIVGDGHVMKNIVVNQQNNNKQFGGLFGALDDTSVLQEVTFENVTYHMLLGTRVPSCCFGLLAGKRESGATLTNVQISGSLLIAGSIFPSSTYYDRVGVLFGEGDVSDMDLSHITVGKIDPEDPAIVVTVDEDNRVVIQFS